jgi:hypothetical protein
MVNKVEYMMPALAEKMMAAALLLVTAKTTIPQE